MSSLPTRTIHCFRCQHVPPSDGPPLKRCGGCHARHYCSQTCQKNDWSHHKKECRALASNGPVPQRSRATFRVNLASLQAGLNGMKNNSNTHDSDTDYSNSNSNSNTTTIYHLKTTLAHLNDISLSGPYASPAALTQQIKFRLAQAKATEGEASFADMEKYVGGMAHFKAPLPHGNVMRFEILKEENEAVKRAIPGETYVVVSAKPVMSAAMAGMGGSESEDGRPPLEEMDWHGTFVDKGEAERRVRAVLEKFKGGMEGGVVRMLEEKRAFGFVSGRASEDGMRIVQVTVDPGRIVQVTVDDDATVSYV